MRVKTPKYKIGDVIRSCDNSIPGTLTITEVSMNIEWNKVEYVVKKDNIDRITYRMTDFIENYYYCIKDKRREILKELLG